MANLPLSGIRVLDLTRVIAGPLSTQSLADFGADVVKVERPGSGDDSRGFGPGFFDAPGGGRIASYFCSHNRGKRSIAVDMRDPAQLKALQELAGRCDVLVENYKVGDLARHGLDYETLRAANPGLVYCSVTGFGQTGPYAERAGYDALIQATSGLMSVTGPPAAAGESTPLRTGVPVTDVLTGIYAFSGILLALIERQRSGLGQHIDVALMDVATSMVGTVVGQYLTTGEVPAPVGNRSPSTAPVGAYRCSDGEYLMLMCSKEDQFVTFCEVVGRPELARDPRFATNAARVRACDALDAVIEPILLQRPRAEWLALMLRAKLIVGPVNRMPDLLADPQVQARETIVQLSDEGERPIRVVRNPLRLSRTPPVHRPPPIRPGEAAGDLEDIRALWR